MPWVLTVTDGEVPAAVYPPDPAADEEGAASPLVRLDSLAFRSSAVA